MYSNLPSFTPAKKDSEVPVEVFENGLIYTKYYGLETLPFENVPDPAFFFNQGEYTRVFEHLAACLKAGRGLMVVAGPIGAGKTTLSQKIMFSFPESSKLIWMSEPPENSNDFFLLLAQELGGEITPPLNRSLTLHAIRERLLELYKEKRRCLAIVDEVHKITDDVLEAIRLLNNLEHGAFKLIQLILLGQEEFLTRLAQPVLSSFRQRIAALEVISTMDPVGVRDYILHRLRVAGGRPEIFTEGALDTIANITGGVPRVINSVCDRALRAGFSRGKERIDMDEVKEAVQDLGDIGMDRKLFFYLLDKEHARPAGGGPTPVPDPRLIASPEPQATCPLWSGNANPELIPGMDLITQVNELGSFWTTKRKLSLGLALAAMLTLVSASIYFNLKPSAKPTGVTEFTNPFPIQEEVARIQPPAMNSLPAGEPPLASLPQTADETSITHLEPDKSPEPRSPPSVEQLDATSVITPRLPDEQPPLPAPSPGTSEPVKPVALPLTTMPFTSSLTTAPATSPASHVAPSKPRMTTPKRGASPIKKQVVISTASPKKKRVIKRQPQMQPWPITKTNKNESNANWFRMLFQGGDSNSSNNNGWNDTR